MRLEKEEAKKKEMQFAKFEKIRKKKIEKQKA